MAHVYKVPLILAPQAEGGYTVTSPLLPELLTEGDTVEEAMANVHDALEAVLELYDDLGKRLPLSVLHSVGTDAIWFEYLVSAGRDIGRSSGS